VKLLFLAAAAVIQLINAQGLNPEELLKAPTANWPQFNGDYSGRRYSPLKQINKDNAHTLTVAWAFQSRVNNLKGTPLEVNGTVYMSAPDHVWAIDARTGRRLWHYERPSEGDHIASRGVSMYKNQLYFGTPDAHLICLDARTGKELWNKVIADVAFGYYISLAPLIVKDKVIVGTSGDSADVPHFLEALRPETGEVLWRWNSIPEPGQAGSETWPNAESMKHGGGPLWITGTYDPALNLMYWGTGNPHPVLAGGGRRGDNLYTCSIVAINPDTGKLAWYFQPSPHDTHDWDAVETPVLFDADFAGKPRKLLAQASRNGYFFVLDRSTGEHLLTENFAHVDWTKGIDKAGRPIPDPAKDPQPEGAFTRSPADGSTNWMAPSYDPDTKLFYVNAEEGSSMWYLLLDPEKKPEGHQAGATNTFWQQTHLLALDYQTGKPKWTREAGDGRGFPGILTTAGGVLFSGDVAGGIFALDATTGKTLWHTYGGGNFNSSPITYELDGKQYVLTCVDGTVYAWTLPD